MDTMTDIHIPGMPAPGARIVVAMSGGVDSSVTAALLKESGYDVIGVTLQLYDHGQAVSKPGACCAGRDIVDARNVAAALDIPHYVLDFEDRFREAVIADFARSYLKGETPVPCVRCNETVKFTDLLEKARELGAERLVTGHYVQRVDGPDGPKLHRGADHGRDQSYFLFSMTRAQLAFLAFPLGSLDKDGTRALAKRFGLTVADKPDSQDICFVPDGSYKEVVLKLHPEAHQPGDIVDSGGNVLGRHEGIVNFTVGQRRGLGVSAAHPLYVVRLEPETGRVVVGPEQALMRSRLILHGVNWLGAEPMSDSGVPVQVKLRSTQPPVAATVRPTAADSLGHIGADVLLDEPQAGVAPGQACVFYDGERVLGGGWISRDDG